MLNLNLLEYRIMAAVKVKTNIISSKSVRLMGRAV
jgi:hypothetical protein